MTHTNLENLGVIAGRGLFPILVCKHARLTGGVKNIVVIAYHDETDPSISEYADHVEWHYVGQLSKTMKTLKKHNVEHAIMAGQIKPSKLFKGLRPDLKTFILLAKLKERNAESIFGALADEFKKKNIEIISSVTYLGEFMAKEGILGGIKLNTSRKKDAEYGTQVANEISRLDIGQTVVVKKGTILAVEGFEGTDKAILRGGELGHGGVTVVKVAKPNQDMRFDVPCIGLRTVEFMIKAKVITLAIQSNKTLFIEKEKVIEECNKHKICLIGI